jgi:hypothetical protein
LPISWKASAHAGFWLFCFSLAGKFPGNEVVRPSTTRKAHTMNGNDVTLPPELAKIANGRDYVTTPETGQALSLKPQTVRKNHALTGECCGIKPTKLPNNRLLWPVISIAAVLVRRSAK